MKIRYKLEREIEINVNDINHNRVKEGEDLIKLKEKQDSKKRLDKHDQYKKKRERIGNRIESKQ